MKPKAARQREENRPRFFQSGLDLITSRSIGALMNDAIPQGVNSRGLQGLEKWNQLRITQSFDRAVLRLSLERPERLR